MLNEQINIMEELNNHFSKCWLDIDFDYNQIMPERIAYMLTRDVKTEECEHLSKNYRKNEIVYLYSNIDILNDDDLSNRTRIKHLNYTEPFDVFILPEDALLQLAFNN